MMGQQPTQQLEESPNQVYILSCFNSPNLPIINVKINNNIYRALLDSGAGLNLIGKEVIENMNLELTPCSVVVKTIARQESRIKNSTELSLQIEENTFKVDFFIMTNVISREFSLILGAPFLRQYKCSLDFENNCMGMEDLVVQFGDGQSSGTSNEEQSKGEDMCYAYAVQKTTVPPGSQAIIEAKLKKEINAKILLAEPLWQVGEKDFMVARAVYQNENKPIPVLVINTTDAKIHINKSTKLIKCHPILSSKDLPQASINYFAQDPEFGTCEEADLEWSRKFKLDHLDETTKKKLETILEEYKEAFAGTVQELPGCDTLLHKINLYDQIPVKRKQYRVPYNLREEMDKQIAVLLEADILEPSTSPYAAPVLLVKKPNGDFRFVADFRELNKKVIADCYPLPLINEAVDNLQGSKIFSTLDLTSGFFQQMLDPEDRHKTAISTNQGLYQFKRTPFGLKTSANSFQRLMEIVLSGLKPSQIFVYVDDIVIASDTIDSHLEKLKLVFNRLLLHNLKLKPSKCNFLKESITYLGYVVSQGKIFPDQKNVEIVENFKIPTCRKHVRSFLGCVNYYRKFIPDFSRRSINLTNLTKETKHFQWTKDAQREFEDLKTALTKRPCLTLPDMAQDFVIFTDASNSAIGGVIAQLDGNGFPKPIAFASRKLNSAEKVYSTTEREVLAIIFTVGYFRPYLYGKKFTIYTDHASLTHVLKLKDPTGRIARWALTLSDFNYEIKYITGKCNRVADFLSRGVDHEKQTEAKKVFALQPDQPVEISFHQKLFEKLLRYQQLDKTCQSISKDLQEGNLVKPQGLRFFLDRGILRCKGLDCTEEDQARIVLPKSMIYEVLSQLHDSPSSCHPGVRKTLLRVKRHYYWPGMTQHIVNWVKSCNSCMEKRGHKPKALAPLQRSEIPEGPFQKVAIDIVGPLPISDQGNKYLITYIDHFSRWCEAYPVPEIGSKDVARTLLDFTSRFGCPAVILTDKGTNLISESMQSLYRSLGIKKVQTTAYHPQGNGMLEVYHRSLGNALSHLVNDNHTDWDLKLNYALLAYRTTWHSATRHTPAFLVYGKELNLPYQMLEKDWPFSYRESEDYVEALLKRQHAAYKRVKTNLEKAAEAQEQYRNKIARDKGLKVGDMVYVYYPHTKQGLSGKFSKPNKGGYVIERKISDVVFEIREVNNPQRKQIINVDRLVKATQRLEHEEREENDYPEDNTDPSPSAAVNPTTKGKRGARKTPAASSPLRREYNLRNRQQGRVIS